MVTVKQFQETGLGACGALGAKKAHGTNQIIQVVQIQLQFHHPKGGALSYRCGLGGLEMGECKGWKFLIGIGKLSQFS